MFRTFDVQLIRVPSIFRWEFLSLRYQLVDFGSQPTYLLVRVSQPLSLGYCDETYDDSLALTLPSFRLALAPV